MMLMDALSREGSRYWYRCCIGSAAIAIAAVIAACGRPDPAETARIHQAVQTAKARPTATPVPRVANSLWDGSVVQVVQFVDREFPRWSNVTYTEWSPVVVLRDGSFAVRCRFNAVRSGGVFFTFERIFYLSDKGTVTGYDDGHRLRIHREYEAVDLLVPDRPPVRQWEDPHGRLHITN